MAWDELPVPIRFEGDPPQDADYLVTFHTAGARPQQIDEIQAIVQKWYEDGVNGGFPLTDLVASGMESAFHVIIGPSVEGNALRWQIDFGLADPSLALTALSERLAALSDVVEELVIGPW